jgi:hypothetical protein
MEQPLQLKLAVVHQPRVPQKLPLKILDVLPSVGRTVGQVGELHELRFIQPTVLVGLAPNQIDVLNDKLPRAHVKAMPTSVLLQLLDLHLQLLQLPLQLSILPNNLPLLLLKLLPEDLQFLLMELLYLPESINGYSTCMKDWCALSFNCATCVCSSVLAAWQVAQMLLLAAVLKLRVE